jgi:hypothetical protein
VAKVDFDLRLEHIGPQVPGQPSDSLDQSSPDGDRQITAALIIERYGWLMKSTQCSTEYFSEGCCDWSIYT